MLSSKTLSYQRGSEGKPIKQKKHRSDYRVVSTEFLKSCTQKLRVKPAKKNS